MYYRASYFFIFMQQRIIRLFSLLLFLSLFSASAFAQIERALKWQNTPPPSSVAVGDVVTLTFEATIEKSYHIYSSKQPSTAVLPAAFELDKTSVGVELVGEMQEVGDRHVVHDDIFEADIAQYEGKVVFSQQVKITAPDAKIAAAITYQVCDASRCIPGEHVFSYTFKAKAAKK